MSTLTIADLFCGAGGTSTGAVEAIELLGYRADLTAINHWPVAVATHEKNHPGARHLCASLDSINPRQLFKRGELQLLWASPECTHHSQARGGMPINDQSRATAWCVTRWAEALLPQTILVENVPEFRTWGPIGANGKPLKSRKGETFQAWLAALKALGYRVDHRVLCAADYGDPQTRHRLFVQAQRGRRQIVWPEALHHEHGRAASIDDGFLPWPTAEKDVIDWSIPAPLISKRKRPLAANTMRRIREGIARYGGRPFLIAMEHGGRVLPASAPAPTITCAKGGAIGVAYVLPQHGGGALRPASKPVPTVATAGALALVVEYYGTGKARPVNQPLPTVTTHDRFALVKVTRRGVGFRMFKRHELAAAQGFLPDYEFTGKCEDVTKQIGNAVPRRLARAICLAALGQRSDLRSWLRQLPEYQEKKAVA